MRSMQWQLGMLGTISAFAYRNRETEKNLCRGGRSQDLPSRQPQGLALASWTCRLSRASCVTLCRSAASCNRQTLTQFCATVLQRHRRLCPTATAVTSPNCLPSSFKTCSIASFHSTITTHHRYCDNTVYTKVFQRSVFGISSLMYCFVLETPAGWRLGDKHVCLCAQMCVCVHK